MPNHKPWCERSRSWHQTDPLALISVLCTCGDGERRRGERRQATDPTDTRDAEVKCADGMACLHPGDCQARGACHIDYPYSDEYVEGLRAEITRLRALLEGHSGAREPVALGAVDDEGNCLEAVPLHPIDASDEFREYWEFDSSARVVPLYATPEPAEMEGERIEGYAEYDGFEVRFKCEDPESHYLIDGPATLILAPPDSTGEEET